MLDFYLSREQEEIRLTVRKFAEKEIRPRVKEMVEKKEIPDEIIKGMAELGLLGMCVSEEYGGSGLDAVLAGVVAEELARADTTCSIPIFFLVECAWGYLLDKYGTPEAKKEILPKVCRGEQFLGIATTEPGCGSDLAAMKTRIDKDKDVFLVNGEKRYITGVREAQKYGGGFICLAKQTPEAGTRGMTLFYLPVAKNGILTSGITPRFEEKLGWEGVSFGGFTLDNVKVPSKYILGQENRGFHSIHEGYEFARGLMPFICVGAASKILEDVMEYMKQRKVLGQPLIKYEANQFSIAEHFTKLEAGRLLGLKAFWMFNKEQKEKKFTRFEVSQAMATPGVIVPDIALSAINDAMQWYGAFGYTLECEAQQAWRGVRAIKWGGGATEVVKLIVARGILGKD